MPKESGYNVCAYCGDGGYYGETRITGHLAKCQMGPPFVRGEAEVLLTSGVLSNPDPPGPKERPTPKTTTKSRPESRKEEAAPAPAPATGATKEDDDWMR